MNSAIISGILAQALVELPRITMSDLYDRCVGQIETATLAQFRIDVATWLNDGTIPGYESRKGPTGGIYRKGSQTVKTSNPTSDSPKIDPAPIGEFIFEYLKTHSRITVGELAGLYDIKPLTEAQFKQQMSFWLNDGVTFPLFESRKGPTGGIYLIGAESDKFIPSEHSSDDGESEHVGGFAVQISPTIKIVQSDERNWTVQKLSGNTWLNKAYHPDIAGCIHSVVKHIVNGEFKCKGSLLQLNELEGMFRAMENRLAEVLKGNIQP